MRAKNAKKIQAAILVISAVILAGCATTISVKRLKPAVLDLENAKSISVLPFQTQEISSTRENNFLSFFEILMTDPEKNPSKPIADYLTSELQTRLINNSKYNVVSSDRVKASLRSGSAVPVDAYITGSITNFKEDIIDTTNYSDSDPTPQFKKRITMTVTYQIIEAKTGIIKGFKVESVKKDSYNYKALKDIPTALGITQNSLDSIAEKILNQIRPYYETKYFTLLTAKNATEGFVEATKDAQRKDYENAQEKFASIYKSTGLFEAGYNAAILLQVQGKYAESKSCMEKVYKDSGNQKAKEAIEDIQSEIDDSRRLEKQQKGIKQ